MNRRQALGLVFVIFGASMMAQVAGVIIDCSNITCTPFSGILTILLTIIALLSIILGYDHLVE
jgi:hypothetical protein